MRVGRRVAAGVVAILMAGCVTGCQTADKSDTSVDSETTLRIIAGSEQESVLNTIVLPWCEAHGYDCPITLKGSVDQARLLASGGGDYDAYWFASSVFQQLGDTAGALLDVQPMFLTPIVFAGWEDEMTKLGFAGRSDVSIAEILTAVESGETRVWVTNPTQSNSGATVLLGFMNYFAGNGTGQVLTQEQLDSTAVDEGITRFIRAMDQTPPSTGTLMTECVARPDECKTLFTYEDLVIEQNQALAKAGEETLTVVYPRGSLAVSDAPLGFLPHGTAADSGRQRLFNELQDYLLTDPQAQTALLALGRRPATSIGLTLDNPDLSVFNPAWGIQSTINEQGIQFPTTTVIQAALDRYQTRYRRPVDAYYCLDGSGSMGDNGGWDGVQEAAGQVFDQDQAAANFLQTHPEDRTTVAIFNDGVTGGSPWTVTGNDATQMHGLTEKITSYEPDDGTNMYTCLSKAVKQLTQAQETDRKPLVILMTDGQSDQDGRETVVQALTDTTIPVIAIAFGDDADPTQLQEITEATGGAYFQQDDLVTALRQAAGYK